MSALTNGGALSRSNNRSPRGENLKMRLLAILLLFTTAMPALSQQKVAAKPAASQFWVSVDVGTARATSFSGIGANLGIYGGNRNSVWGLRDGGHFDLGNLFECFGEAFSFGMGESDCERGGSVHETALMVGKYGSKDRRSWYALGIARVDAIGQHDGDQRIIGLGLPMEWVYSPHFSWIGSQLRLSANLNQDNSFVMISAGLRFGDLD